MKMFNTTDESKVRYGMGRNPTILIYLLGTVPVYIEREIKRVPVPYHQDCFMNLTGSKAVLQNRNRNCRSRIILLFSELEPERYSCFWLRPPVQDPVLCQSPFYFQGINLNTYLVGTVPYIGIFLDDPYMKLTRYKKRIVQVNFKLGRSRSQSSGAASQSKIKIK